MKKSNTNKDTLIGVRHITVCRNILSKRNYYGNYNPKFTLTGKWLWECGFKGGDKLRLSVYHKKIVIEIETPREEFYKAK